VTALPAPSISAAITQWSAQPVAIVLAVLLAAGYTAGLRRLRQRQVPWAGGHTALFGVGLLLLVLSSCGFVQAYARSLFWAWTTQTLLLFLIVPVVLMSGQPLHLLRLVSNTKPGGGAARPTARRLDRALESPPLRVLSSPLVGPALVPLVSAGLFFGPVAGWSARSAPFTWALHLALLGLGALIALPLIDTDRDPGSLAVGLALGIGSFELVLDAVPGIALRLHTGTATTFFAHRAAHSWSPSALHDQQVAGAILWCLAEVIDLPFLVLVFRRWLRADAREAAAADAVLEAERSARGQSETSDGQGPSDAPWWLTDPTMQRRLKR
jgi:cytochrome c oxidase assembly factor CtaG